MKMKLVAILAGGLLCSCGVGVDEMRPDAPGAVGQTQNELTVGPTDAAPDAPNPGNTTTNPGPGPGTAGNSKPLAPRDPSTVALPYDPIPVFEGKPGPTAPQSNVRDPVGGPLVLPVVR